MKKVLIAAIVSLSVSAWAQNDHPEGKGPRNRPAVETPNPRALPKLSARVQRPANGTASASAEIAAANITLTARNIVALQEFARAWKSTTDAEMKKKLAEAAKLFAREQSALLDEHNILGDWGRRTSLDGTPAEQIPECRVGANGNPRGCMFDDDVFKDADQQQSGKKRYGIHD